MSREQERLFKEFMDGEGPIEFLELMSWHETAYTLKEVALYVASEANESQLKKVMRQIRYWTQIDLIQVSTLKHVGSGHARQYDFDSIASAAVLLELSPLSLQIPALQAIMVELKILRRNEVLDPFDSSREAAILLWMSHSTIRQRKPKIPVPVMQAMVREMKSFLLKYETDGPINRSGEGDVFLYLMLNRNGGYTTISGEWQPIPPRYGSAVSINLTSIARQIDPQGSVRRALLKLSANLPALMVESPPA